MKNFRQLLIGGFLTAAAISTASAGVIFTTGTDASGVDPAYTATGSPSSIKANVSITSGDIYLVYAETFSVATDSLATDLLVPLASFSATGPFSATLPLDFYIVPDVSGLPDTDSVGNPLDALYEGASAAPTSTTPSIFDVSLTGSDTLTAGATYWLLAKLPGSIPSNCPCNGTSGNYTDVWYHNLSSTKPEGYDTDYNATGWGGVGNPTLAFTIEDTGGSSSAPEPATFFLIGGALVLTGIYRKR
jgi:hypothetical protein